MRDLLTDEIELVHGGRSMNGFSGWLAGNLSNFNSAQAKRNYHEYRRKRDSSNDRASRQRARSRSDMNSAGDQRSSDKPGGR